MTSCIMSLKLKRGKRLHRGVELYFTQSASKHGRRTLLCSAMRELICNWKLWARPALQLRSHNVEQREYLAAAVWQKPRK